MVLEIYAKNCTNGKNINPFWMDTLKLLFHHLDWNLLIKRVLRELNFAE
jgi:hypothetical protein